MLPDTAPPALRLFSRPSLPGWFIMVCVLGILPLHAQVTSGSSSGTPLSLNVTSTASLTVVVPVTATTSILAVPQASASGNAPTPYSTSGGPLDYTSPTAGVNLGASAAGLQVDAGVNTLSLGASLLTDSASSTVNGAAGSQTTTANAGLTGLNAQFGVLSATIDPLIGSTTLLDTSAVSITTGVITSTSTVTGSGPLDASFSNSVADFNISLFGVSLLSFAPATLVADLEAGNPVNAVINLDEVSITLPPSALPDGLAGLAASGLILISNSGIANDGLLTGSASASALTIGFQNINISAVVGGLITVQTHVSGTIGAASTDALQIVPEPTVSALTIGTLAGLLLRRRRKNFV